MTTPTIDNVQTCDDRIHIGTSQSRQCERCGSPLPEGSRRDRRYCGKTCSDLARAERNRRAAGIAKDVTTRSCLSCTREFKTRRWNQVYCGPTCKTYALNHRRIEKRRKTKRRLAPPPQTIAQRAAAIRSNWNEATELRRRRAAL